MHIQRAFSVGTSLYCVVSETNKDVHNIDGVSKNYDVPEQITEIKLFLLDIDPVHNQTISVTDIVSENINKVLRLMENKPSQVMLNISVDEKYWIKLRQPGVIYTQITDKSAPYKHYSIDIKILQQSWGIKPNDAQFSPYQK